MRKIKLFMDTLIEIKIATWNGTAEKEAEAAAERAFEHFRKVEQACSRFNPESELMRACSIAGKPVNISPYLFGPLKFALEVANATDGRFDPTIGKAMEQHGFNQNYLTGERISTASIDSAATYRDIILDESTRSLRLKKPLIIDLGAVAKGFAIDLAAAELNGFEGYIINAGGDVYARGLERKDTPWKIGLQHPVKTAEVIEVFDISNQAVCTSGSYERKNEDNPENHHIILPETTRSPNRWVSSTVIAPSAMLADALSTACFLMEAEEADILLEAAGARGRLITPELKIVKVGGNKDDI
ncbi:FAD:protein FMN transferase [Falsibacillus pallidus]|uniref:FAD:protein FMN transferase n=1 Tax=Falsibacillus pallidus TaxID=493781 RepID=A0A370GSK1_9BACI|nr:FAD:protein FMN transferase [Falsibacillus pallidus]RDI45494.1 thiamine biosynthesis lipoprotein [Falsibacillus pallidus]